MATNKVDLGGPINDFRSSNWDLRVDRPLEHSQGDGMGTVYNGEVGGHVFVATARLHQVNGLTSKPNPSAYRFGDFRMRPGSGIIIKTGAEAPLFADVNADYFGSAEFQHHNVSDLVYTYHDAHGGGADTEKMLRYFVDACKASPAGGLDPYRLDLANSPGRQVPPTFPEFAARKSFPTVKSVFLHSGEESGSGEAASRGFVQLREDFGFPKEKDTLFVKVNYQALPDSGDGLLSTTQRAENGLDTHRWNMQQLAGGAIDQAMYVSSCTAARPWPGRWGLYRCTTTG